MVDPAGLKTAVDSVVRACDVVPGSAAAEQLPLLCEDGTSQPHAEKGVPAVKGPGRPPGAANKSTKEWQRFILANYTSPLQGLAEIATMDLEALAKSLGLNVALTYDKALELLKLKVGCMNALAPYVHQKMPTAIDAGENGLIQLVINTANSAPKREDAPVPGLEIIDLESVHNQTLSGEEMPKSVVMQSVGPSQSHADQQVSGETPTDLRSEGVSR